MKFSRAVSGKRKCHELLNILSPRTSVKPTVTGKGGNCLLCGLNFLVKRTEHLASAIAKFRRSERQILSLVGENASDFQRESNVLKDSVVNLKGEGKILSVGVLCHTGDYQRLTLHILLSGKKI